MKNVPLRRASRVPRPPCPQLCPRLCPREFEGESAEAKANLLRYLRTFLCSPILSLACLLVSCFVCVGLCLFVFVFVFVFVYPFVFVFVCVCVCVCVCLCVCVCVCQVCLGELHSRTPVPE